MFKPIVLALIAIGLSPSVPAAAQPTAAQTPRTRVIILGVDHAAQLVAENDQPGVLAAFLEKAAPDAICIERAPEQAARGDNYEFTYEIQGVIQPFAAARNLSICPFDWMPPAEDVKLGFGMDLDTPLELRKPTGFQGFLTFPEKATLRRDFLANDDPASAENVRKWAATPAPRASQDLARRLYLYRTFMQAQRIRAAAQVRPGKTIVVVVGYFHKGDLEAILSQEPSIELVKASSVGRPDAAAVERATTLAHRGAILSFNLLGVQSGTGVVNWTWVGQVLDRFAAQAPAGETALFQIRLELLTGKITAAEAARRLTQLATTVPADLKFSWTGVEDRSRVDSFVDPFGNLTVRQRARIEAARSLFASGNARAADAMIAQVKTELSPRKAWQLAGYAERLRPTPPK